VKSLHFVFFSYAPRAALKIDWKFDEEEEALEWVCDIICPKRVREGAGGRQRGVLHLVSSDHDNRYGMTPADIT
jgi:hypothetical protein